MSDVEQLPVQPVQAETTKGLLDKFNAVRDLGRIATDLETQVKNIHEAMDSLAPVSSLEAPEGMAFRVIATNPEDPMTVQIQQPEYHNDTVWVQAFPYQYEQVGGPQTETPFGNYYFLGSVIEYGHDRKIWVYNEESSSRVLYREGIRFDALVSSRVKDDSGN